MQKGTDADPTLIWADAIIEVIGDDPIVFVAVVG